jgi:hypothetical protein
MTSHLIYGTALMLNEAQAEIHMGVIILLGNISS